jgi:hypothetical protein
MDRGDQMSQSSWLVAGIVPGVRQPLKKLAIDELTLLKLLGRCWAEAERASRRRVNTIGRRPIGSTRGF